MANRIICARWGTLYGDHAVDQLYESVKANCSVDFEFECFDEFDEELEIYKQTYYRASSQPDERKDEVQNGYHRDDFGGIPHYRKRCLF
mgnify:CR=1 FL=1